MNQGQSNLPTFFDIGSLILWCEKNNNNNHHADKPQQLGFADLFSISPCTYFSVLFTSEKVIERVICISTIILIHYFGFGFTTGNPSSQCKSVVCGTKLHNINMATYIRICMGILTVIDCGLLFASCVVVVPFYYDLSDFIVSCPSTLKGALSCFFGWLYKKCL